ncbi:MAG: hypothetical protein ACREBS_05870 [Nitrososphaerales archaeon]
MHLTTKYFFVGMALVATLAFIFFSASFLINVGSDQINTFYVSKVAGVPNFAAPGSESFWQVVPTVTVPLIASSNYPPSGATGTVAVQMAWTNATSSPELLIKLKYSNYGSGPSYSSPLNFYVNNTAYPDGKVMPAYQNFSCTSQFSNCFQNLYPQVIGTLPLAIGKNYTYPEQSSVILGISPGANTDGWYSVSYKPKMVMGSAGALDTGSGGQAEIWLWSSNPTDNSTRNADYPGLNYPNGTALSTASFGLPPHASYAIDGYTNASAFYQIGGMPNSSQFLYINNPTLETNNLSSITSVSGLLNPFEVQAKGAYNPSSNTWTVEYARSLMTNSSNGENAYQTQLNVSSTKNYYVAFEVNQGQASETYLLYYGSVSFWWRLNFQGTPAYVGYNHAFGANGISSSIACLILAFLFFTYALNGVRMVKPVIAKGPPRFRVSR